MSALPVRSMTGFALVRRDTPSGELTLSLRTVNHRGLDLHFHHGSEFAPYENAMRGELKKHIGRGHVEIRTSVQRATGEARAGLDGAVLAGYVAAFREAAERLGLGSEPDLNALLGLPGVVSASVPAAALDLAEEQVRSATADCAAELNDCRTREGAALADHILDELAGLEVNTDQIRAIRSQALAHFSARLRERLAELLAGANLNEARLAEEAAVLVDRSDIQEEITRLSVHAGELRRLMEAGGEVGKKLDFLLQEMNRESNTVLSKTSGIGDAGLKITELGLGIKAHIEKIREQALNLE